MVRLVTAGVVLTCSSLVASAQPAPATQSPGAVVTLASALSAAGIDPVGIPGAELTAGVSGITISTSGPAIVLAYSDAAVPRSGFLHVRVRGETGRTDWRHAAIDATQYGAGVVTQVRRAGSRLLVDTRIDDDTDTLVVLNASLGVERAVPGHLLALLDDDSVLVRENTAPFAPTRPVLVSTCALSTGEMRRLHPLPPASAPRKRFVDRVQRAYASWRMRGCLEAGHHCNAERFDGAIVSDVRVESRGGRVAWVERLGPPDGMANGPIDFRIHVLVTCALGTAGLAGQCVERAFTTYDGPDGKTTMEVLDSAFRWPRARTTP
jgi:hypothetical protein